MVGLRAPWGVEGGVEAAVAELAPRLVAAGCEVTVYCRGRYNPYGATEREGVRLVDVGTLYGRSSEAIVHTALATPRAALAHDLVHLHACGPGLFAPLPRALGAGCVVTLHGLDWQRDKWGLAARLVLRAGAQAACRYADRVLTVSHAVADAVRPFSRAPVECVPNGVPPHEPEPWDPAVYPELRPGRYVLFVGRLVPEKDLRTLVRAAALARTRSHVVITGGSAYTQEYAQRLRAEAPRGVVFTGPRFGREKRMLLTHARGFVFPSRVEGLPIALLEAMAAGLPIAASTIAANDEALGPCGGWRPGVGDVQAWAQALREIDQSDLEFLRGLGARGVRRVQEHFGWEAVTRRTLAAYEAALATPRPARAQVAL